MQIGPFNARRRLMFAAGALLLASTHAPVWAADVFPDHPVKLIVPYPPGGGNDVLARIIAPSLSKELKQAVTIENRGGAGGTIGTAFAARATPDGYTILIINTLPHTAAAGLYPTLSFDPIKSFDPIGEAATVSYMLAVNPNVPAHSIKEFVALSKAKPKTLYFGSAGNGSATHLAAELIKSVTNADMTHVAYRGGGPALNDLLAGQVQATCENVAALVPYIQAGTLRGLVITGPKRVAAVPSLPTMREEGYAGFDVSGKFGLVAPAGTPPQIIAVLNDALKRALATPELSKLLAAQGAEPAPSSSAEFAALIKAESALWLKVIADAHIKND